MDATGLNILQNLGTEDMEGLPLILKEPFFVVKETVCVLNSTDYQRKSEGIIAVCLTCLVKIKGSKKVTSNFLQHYKIQHIVEYEQYKLKKESSFSKKLLNKQAKFDQKVLKFITSSFSPMSIVENKDFIALFEETGLKVKSRKHMQDLLDRSFNDMEIRIKNKLQNIAHICCTADIWSGNRKSFFGYTVHWIEQDLTRNSAVLACRRFKSPHSYTNIAALIDEINLQYGIDKKQITATITDNGSNFVKAFKAFGIKTIRDDDDSDDEFEFRGFGENEINYQNESDDFSLSKHYRCASHTLNLLSSTDYIKILKNENNLYEKHDNAIIKCEKIWSKTRRPKSFEIIFEITSATLKTPTVTRWNSLFDSIQHLISFKNKLDEITTALDIDDFLKEDLEYLEEYIKLMKPIAEALDFLQSEKDIYYGYLLPTLLTLKFKLKKCCENLLFLKYVGQELISCLENRFKSIFILEKKSYEAVVAAITCPQVRFLKCTKLIEVWQETSPFVNETYLENLFEWLLPKDTNITLTNNRTNDLNLATTHRFFNIYEMDNEGVETPVQENGDTNIKELRYYTLETGNTFKDINKYNIIKSTFFKTNTPLPSSAPVERLFSLAGMVNQKRRQRLTDNNFEKFVLTKANLKYF